MKYFILYLIIINLIALAIMGIDKKLAKAKAWRIPESVLLTLAFIGGSIGALSGMFLFRHKTRHRKFTILLPLFLILHLAIALLASGLI